MIWAELDSSAPNWQLRVQHANTTPSMIASARAQATSLLTWMLSLVVSKKTLRKALVNLADAEDVVARPTTLRSRTFHGEYLVTRRVAQYSGTAPGALTPSPHTAYTAFELGALEEDFSSEEDRRDRRRQLLRESGML